VARERRPPPKPPRTLRRRILAVAAGVAVGLLLVCVGLAWAYQRWVVSDPGSHIAREHVRAIIAQESPVYYRDGTTRVGVFFEAEHRDFVPYAEMPEAYVVGLVAAEDERFWTHAGVDLWGILRAVRSNVVAREVVAGGSTLTQQTAKNLYYRPDRSVRSKVVELVNALRLEAHYDKSEILEFYANQFHVTGNGRGLGIAARHFFDEDVKDLDVAECAFLAGLVKAPAWYDPFLGDEVRRDAATARAHDRTRYVLQRIVENPPEQLAGPHAPPERLAEARRVRDEAAKLLETGFTLPFRRGTFRYESSAVLDEVAKRLTEPPFDAILGHAGIDSAASAGLVVVTTLDADVQREATYALWHHLTEVGLWMEGPRPERLLLPAERAPRFDPDFPPRRHEFRVARVDEHGGQAGAGTLSLDLGGHTCTVDRDGVVRVAVAALRGARGDSTVRASTAEVDAFAATFPTGSVVFASVREPPQADGRPALCDLEVRPELQGAIDVIQDGEIRAMVGGNDNRNFNRATALRQFGSTWKPLVYHAALRLGWSPDDVLDNTRNVFPFSTTFYYPRPDHEGPERVSLAWAGVQSENLASIWLLYHLTDRLDGDEVRALATSLDLARRPSESAVDYRMRIQKAGILPTRDRVPEGLFLQSRQEVLAGLADGAHPEDATALASLSYGWGYAGERNRVAREGPAARAQKLEALGADFRWLDDRAAACRTQYATLAEAFEERRVPPGDVVHDLSVLVDGDVIRVACGAVPEGHTPPDAAFFEGVPGFDDPPLAVVSSQPPDEPERKRDGGWFGFGRRDDVSTPEPVAPAGPTLAALEDVLLEDRLHLSTLDAVSAAFDRRSLAWDLQDTVPDLYDPEILFWHQDFRVLLAMRTVAALAEDYGVQTPIREVVSLPLGASEITLEEATSLYGGLVTGRAWSFPGRSSGAEVASVPTSTLLIQEIRDVDGRVLYQATPASTDVTDRAVADMTADILRNVVLHGTGRRASSALRHGGTFLPVGGKTGTTNDFRNAAFVGFAPAWGSRGYDPRRGFVVGAYVGYDDNRELVNGRIRLAGASAALPAWIDTVEGLVAADLLGDPPASPGAASLVADVSLVRLPVDPSTGLPLAPSAAVGSLDPSAASVLVREGHAMRAGVRFTPIDRPPRIAPGTDEALRIRPALE
jgi:membrane peptidoglycan carboxypeptidase